MLFALLQDHALRLPTPDQIADPRAFLALCSGMKG